MQSEYLNFQLHTGFILKKTSDKPIMLVNRASGKIEQETVFGDRSLRFMYDTLLGRTLWGICFNSRGLSDLLGRYYDSPRSHKSIAKLAAIPGCAPEEAEKSPDEYGSFNEFFARKLKVGARPCDFAAEKFVSPADGRVFVYSNLSADDPIPVKGARRTLRELCLDKLPADKLAVAVIRLAPVDYHRFHFPCDCVQAAEPLVFAGKYHSVNPVALLKRPDLFVENTRQLTELESEVFGRFCYLEVGAFGVGSIIQTSGVGRHVKQEEKGYFKFGGSTVIVVLDNSKAEWEPDLLENSRNGYETLLKTGSTLATAVK